MTQPVRAGGPDGQSGRGVHAAPGVHVADSHGGRTVTIDRPERANALTTAMLQTIAAAVDGAAAAGLGAIVLTGAGGRFSAGVDLEELTGTVADLAVDEAIGQTADAIAASPLVTVAAVDGAAFGAAVELARTCDLVVASRRARFAIPAVRLGLLYRPQAIARLHRRIGGAAARVVMLGEELDASLAARLGLVDRVVDEPLTDAVTALVERLGRAVPDAVAATKSLLAELDGGADETTVAERFEPVRRRLLESPSRRAAVAAAHHRHRDPDKGT